MHHRLQSGANRLKSRQSQQVQDGGSQRCHHAGPIAPVAVTILMELGVTDPVPALNAPAVSRQFQQGFWCCAQAGVAPRGALYEKSQVSRLKLLAVPDPIGGHLHDPAGCDPGLLDVLQRLFRSQRSADVAAVVDLVIGCLERDLPFPLELTADLTVQRLLVGSSLLFEKVSPTRKASPTPSGGSRPPAPAAVEKRFLGVERVSLDENTLKIQLAEQLPQHCPLVGFAGGVAGLAVAVRLLRSSTPPPRQPNTG